MDVTRGLTLLEMLIVVMILAVVAGMAVPHFARASGRMELRQAARDLAAVIRYGQTRAMMHGRPGRLAVQADAFWLEEAREDHAEVFDRVPGLWGRRTRLMDSLTLEAPAEPLLFPPDGRMAPAEFRLCRAQVCLRVTAARRRVEVKDDAQDNP